MRNRIKAYTFLDVLLSLVIIAVISGIIFSLTFSYQKQYSKTLSENNKISSLILLRENLNRESFFAKTINEINKGMLFKFQDSSEVRYSFLENYIVRNYNNLKQDTFFIKSLSVDFKKKVDNNSHINEISLRVLVLNDEIVFNFYKKYDADIIINNKYSNYGG